MDIVTKVQAPPPVPRDSHSSTPQGDTGAAGLKGDKVSVVIREG